MDEEGRVRAVRHPTLDLDLAAKQVFDRVVDVVDTQFRPLLLVGPRVVGVVDLVVHAAQFILGHAWPSGSIGLPHHVHSARPDSIT